ncbi:GNAT family N-acetyltransferase [Neobacillus pocheonensis]|uniref:GNAT family N-acetyltransferase n=1 Tax=Neobacillus pocheonensis TaxID=363869 RepID=UPI003D2D3DC1
MQITFKKLTECTIQDVVTAWNRGFEGYFVKIDMTPELFFNRVVNEGLSLNHSIVGFDSDEPIAILMNGFRTINGKKTAWNGGTGIATDYRGKGVSKLLMEETLKIYREEGVEVATLEAIKENERAIRLYQSYGYEITDSLVYLSGALKVTTMTSIQTDSIRPEQLPLLPCYKEDLPWQCQWQSVKSGVAQVYYDEAGNPLGYSLFKRVWNQAGKLEKVFLYQLELLVDVSGKTIDGIFTKITDHVDVAVNLMTINASLTNPAIQYLLENGFTKATEQVQMVKK